MKPRTVLIGGWEFTKDDGIDKKISDMSNRKIVLIPDASKFSEKQIDRATETYRRYNTEVQLLGEKAERVPEDINVVYLDEMMAGCRV